jgi:hypothetical protein
MKKWICVLLVLLLAVCLLTSCDPVLPEQKLSVVCTPHPLAIGQTAELTLQYPDTEGTPIVAWGTPLVTVLEGKDIIATDGLQVTAIGTGTARILVEVKADCAFMGIVIDHPSFQTEVEITVAP